MEKECLYYCIPDIGVDDNSNLLKPFRILRLNRDSPLIPNETIGFETLKELRKKDSNWKSYYLKDPKSAEKICKDEFIIKTENFILLPSDEEFKEVSFKLLKHNVFGELSNEIKGIHLYSKLNRSIIDVRSIGGTDRRGVWLARIEYYSIKRQKTFVKEQSSMFPLNWDATRYMFEIFHAYKNRKMCESDNTKFHSITLSGIPVDFIIVNNVLRTVYPIFEEMT